METLFAKENIEYQRKLSRVSIKAGQLLLQHGAESALVGSLTKRFGIALGADDVEVSLSASSMTISTILEGHCMTTTRRCEDRGINMQITTEILRLCVDAEHKTYDIFQIDKKLNEIDSTKYNRFLVAFMVGMSCASISHLHGGSLSAFIVTFFASFIGMIVRHEISSRQFNPMVNFCVTAFIVTSISGLCIMTKLVDTPFVVMGSSVLLLVPGVPLINAVSDMIKGYTNMGIARWAVASLLTLATSMGIVAAMSIFKVWGWQ